MTYKVSIILKTNSQPILYDATSVYEKGSFTCILFKDDKGEPTVDKYPTVDIFKLREQYTYILTWG